MEDEFGQQFRLVLIMAAADGVEIVGLRRIAFLVGCLDAAFGHARIGIAHAQFRRHEDLGAVPCRFDGSRRTGAATADDQDIRFELDVIQIDVSRVHAALALQQGSQFLRHFIAFIGADGQDGKAFFMVIRMILAQEFPLLFSREARQFFRQTDIPRSFDPRLGSPHFFCINHDVPLFLDIPRFI